MSEVSDAAARIQRLRVALTMFPALYVVLGLVFLLQSPLRTTGPAFTAARAIPGGMETWGVVFVVLGCVQFATLATHVRWFITGLVVGSGLVWFWWYLIVKSTLGNDTVSWSGAVWIGFCAAAHILIAWLIGRSELRHPAGPPL